MNNYAIYCTEEQTKKALELGAPIERRSHNYDPSNRYFRFKLHPSKYGGTGYYYVKYTTAEQMISWLEEQEGILGICIRRDYGWFYQISFKGAPYYNYSATCQTRKEATLAAIDNALEYLILKKGE